LITSLTANRPVRTIDIPARQIGTASSAVSTIAACGVDGGLVADSVRLALDQLQPFERATTRVTTIRGVPGETSDDGAMTAYHIRVDYEHDCPNGACDDYIGKD
jgi:hypothetical protein